MVVLDAVTFVSANRRAVGAIRRALINSRNCSKDDGSYGCDSTVWNATRAADVPDSTKCRDKDSSVESPKCEDDARCHSGHEGERRELHSDDWKIRKT